MTSDDITTAIFQAPIPFLNSTQQQACHQVIASLSQQQIEQAACTSYAYYAADKSTFSHHDVRTHMALRMARRHLIQHRGNVELATAAMKDTLEFRERMEINSLREQYCKTQKDIYTHPIVDTVAVCGYDVDNRAILVRYPERFSSPSDEASMKLLCYELERALACTERKSLGEEEKMIVAIDYGHGSGDTPPFRLMKSMVLMLQHHYPERLHMFISVVSTDVLDMTCLNVWNFILSFHKRYLH